LYLDAIWVLNVSIDSLILGFSSILLKRGIRFIRCLGGGLVGSLTLFLDFVPIEKAWVVITLKISFSLLMILVTFGFKRVKLFLENLFALYFSTFIFGGGLMGIHFLFQESLISNHDSSFHTIQSYGDPVGWGFVVIGIPALYFFSKNRLTNIQNSIIEVKSFIEVEISILETSLKTIGLIDSGNRVTEPISGYPVFFVSKSLWQNQLPKDVIRYLTEEQELLEELPSAWSKRMRSIPLQSIGQQNQIRTAFRMDHLVFESEGHKYRLTKGYLVFEHAELSPSKQFAAIIHPSILSQSQLFHVS
jgi:stage II sporulation protein GA (sporulation sigma-E factor processing peptidase)